MDYRQRARIDKGQEELQFTTIRATSTRTKMDFSKVIITHRHHQLARRTPMQLENVLIQVALTRRRTTVSPVSNGRHLTTHPIYLTQNSDLVFATTSCHKSDTCNKPTDYFGDSLGNGRHSLFIGAFATRLDDHCSIHRTPSLILLELLAALPRCDPWCR